jgi:hypothetical protein
VTKEVGHKIVQLAEEGVVIEATANAKTVDAHTGSKRFHKNRRG